MRKRLTLCLLLAAGCMTDPAAQPGLDGGLLIVDDAGLARFSVAPTLRAGIDPSIFLPTLVVGYHPTAEELATSGKACSGEADCATSGGQVVFHCSTPYYGQAQCQGVFPAGDQVQPGVTPSCAYYECPTGFECEAGAETHSVTCLEDQPHHGRADGGH
jgi:hypothetical protein